MHRCLPLRILTLTFISASFAVGDSGSQPDGSLPSSIAVVGAGIGGTAAAHFLRQQFGPEVRIDVFEKDVVGGRLATVTVNQQDYEASGAAIHPLHLHMQDLVKQLGLRYRRSVGGKTAVFDGEQVVLGESDWFLLDLLRLCWRYGTSLIRLRMWVEEVMEKFMRIYKYQSHGYAFSSVEVLLRSLGGPGLLNLTGRPLGDALLELGVTQRFIDEVVTPALRGSHGHNTSIPAFLGAVSLAGAQASLWAVEGGNKLVCSGLLELAKAHLVQAQVTTISPHTAGGSTRYRLDYTTPTGPASRLYDVVVVTTPPHAPPPSSSISFQGFDPPLPAVGGGYQCTVASVVHGYLNSSYFGFPDARLFPFSVVLTTAAPGLFFSAAASLAPVNVSASYRRRRAQEAAVYRVFSPAPLARAQLKTLFRSYYSVQEMAWEGGPGGLPPVIFHHALYYLNAIEWAGVAMETSAVAAKNIALLAGHRWTGRMDMVDQEDLLQRVKTEL